MYDLRATMNTTGPLPPFITRVRLRNYRSIAGCDVTLQSLAILVGANGSGKSNFLDALRLFAESLRGSLDQTLDKRGGVAEVLRKSPDVPHDLGIRLDTSLSNADQLELFDPAPRHALAPT